MEAEPARAGQLSTQGASQASKAQPAAVRPVLTSSEKPNSLKCSFFLKYSACGDEDPDSSQPGDKKGYVGHAQATDIGHTGPLRGWSMCWQAQSNFPQYSGEDMMQGERELGCKH